MNAKQDLRDERVELFSFDRARGVAKRKNERDLIVYEVFSPYMWLS